jgi:hypothetical protein
VTPPIADQPLSDAVERMLAHSLRLVLPRMMAPAARNRATTGASRPVTLFASASDPAVVAMGSAVSILSFTNMGMPCSGPRAPLAFRSASSAVASAMALGLITSNPDDIDWADEIRMALEERASMSPDALTGLEANLRFNGKENMATRVFGRLSAWQNWIFIRPNAVGELGALKVYGSGNKAKFDFERV